MKRTQLILLNIFLLPFLGLSQEICDNGIDDDGDNTIDLYDVDCDCFCSCDSIPYQVESLLNNPSFELSTCCPSGFSEFDCLLFWDFGDDYSTTDYFNICGFTGSTILEYPTPLPNGSGFVGFVHGDPATADNVAGYKEYAATCLRKPLQAGKTYSFNFDLGFGFQEDFSSYWHSRSPVEIGLFGAQNCTDFPFEHSISDPYGCPTEHDERWVQLGSAVIIGENEWVRTQITFTPTQTINAIMIGPSCESLPSPDSSYYYFLDNLEFRDTTYLYATEPEIVPSFSCSDSVELTFTMPEGFVDVNFQWYMSGAAIPGANLATLKIAYYQSFQLYHVIVFTDEGCFRSPAYLHQSLPLKLETTTTQNAACKGVSNGMIKVEEVDISGGEPPFLFSVDGATFLPIGSTVTGLEGDQLYEVILQDSRGCEDVMMVYVGVGESISVALGADREAELGTIVTVNAVTNAGTFSTFEWSFVENTTYAESCTDCLDYAFQFVQDTTLVLHVIDENGCSANDTLVVKAISPKEVYLPNAFSPNNDGVNDNFTWYYSAGPLRVNSFQVFDRWGNLVYDTKTNGRAEWNGTVGGKIAPEGIYVYLLETTFSDGKKEIFKGDVLLLR